MEIEEEAETEKEDLKARGTQKVSHNLCNICIYFTVLDSMKESLPLHHLEQYSHFLLLRIMI